MKKIVRIMGLCALVSLALVSCKKTETKTFSISSARVSSDSKTHIVPDASSSTSGIKQLVWDTDDEIKVFNKTGEYKAFTVTEDYNGNPTATFNLVGDQISFMNQLGENGGNNYTAFYPYAVGQDNEVRIPVLARQTFDGLDFLPNTFPMYGNDNADGDFEFNTNAGLLVIEFERSISATDEQASLDSLELIAVNPEKNLAGNYVYYNDGTSNENPVFEGSGNSIMLVPTETITIPSLYTGIVFSWLFVVPEIDLSDGFVVRGYYNGEQKFSLGGRASIQKGTITYMNSRVTLPVING